MIMKTNDLIDELTTNLEPVRRLWKPEARAAAWSAIALVYIVALAVTMARGAVSVDVLAAQFWLPQAAAIAASFVAARAAFVSVLPGYRAHAVAWMALAASLWLGSLTAFARWPIAIDAIASARHEWLCVAVIVVGGAPLMGAMVWLLRRGAPLTPVSTMAAAALAVGAMANVGACLSLPHADHAITLFWHGGVVALLMALAAVAGALVLSWRRPSS